MSSGSDSGTVGMQLETRATFSSESRNIMSIMNDFVDLVESRIGRWLEDFAFLTK